MYVIFLMVLGLLSPLPFVTPFSYDFVSDSDIENVRYGSTDIQRGFNHDVKNPIINAYAQTANSTQVTFIDIRTLKNNYTAGETVITTIDLNSSSSDFNIIYRITNPHGNFIHVEQIEYMSGIPTIVSTNTDMWKQSGTYTIIVDYNGSQASSSIMFDASYQTFDNKPAIIVSTLKNNYTTGENIITVITTNFSSFDTIITYKITNPQGDFIDFKQIDHMSNNPIVLSINTNSNGWIQSGTYTIIVDYNGNQGSSSIMFDANSQGSIPKTYSTHLNVSTDKEDYRSGDIISVNTTLQNYSTYNNSAILIIVSPSGKVLNTTEINHIFNNSNIFTHNVSTLEWIESGTYEIIIVYDSGYSATTFTFTFDWDAFMNPSPSKNNLIKVYTSKNNLISVYTSKNNFVDGESIIMSITINSSSNYASTLYNIATTYKITNPKNQIVHVGQFIPTNNVPEIINIKTSGDHLWSESGTYTINIYHNGINRSESIIFNVNTQAFYPKFVNVSIPSGSSIPGCETDDTCFIPAHVNISLGGTVTWTNDDTAVHTVTSGSPSNGVDGEFDSSLILPSAEFSYTATSVKTYDYFCIVHPWQTGTVNVIDIKYTVPKLVNLTVSSNNPNSNQATIGDIVKVYLEINKTIDVIPNATILGIPANINISINTSTVFITIPDKSINENITFSIYVRDRHQNIIHVTERDVNSSNVFIDTIKPEITINGHHELSITPGDTYNDKGAIISDSNPLYFGNVLSNASSINTLNEGTYTILYRAHADLAGNRAIDATRTLIVTNEPKIMFEKNVYAWRDIVKFKIATPKENSNKNIIEQIGDTVNESVKIFTLNDSIGYYFLTETGFDTGIFEGSVNLSGFLHDVTGNNNVVKPAVTTQTSHYNTTPGPKGPFDGNIGSRNNDVISISYNTLGNSIITKSVPVEWNIGMIMWDNTEYDSKDHAIVRIVDPDLNINRNTSDVFAIDVWSGADPTGISLNVSEIYQGIFEGLVNFTLTKQSQGHTLQIYLNDTITARYADHTLPEPYTIDDDVDIFSNARIKAYQSLAAVSIPSGSSIPGCETDDTCFIPAHVNISLNGTVTWTNDDTVVHTVTSGSPSNGVSGEFDSSLISPGAEFSYTATSVKTYDYFCIVHPWQTGTITVNSIILENNFINNSTGTVGTLTWKLPNHTVTDDALLQIVEPDLNTNNNIIDNFRVNVWSDSDSEGISLNVIETGNNTGVFEGIVRFTTSGKSNGHILLVSFGGTVTAKYEDQSLPLQYDAFDKLEILAITTITTTHIPSPVLLEMTISSSNNNAKYAKQGDVLIVTLVADRYLTGANAQIFGRNVPVSIYNNTATFETNVTYNDHGFASFTMSVSNETEIGIGALAVTQNDLNSSNIFVDTLPPKIYVLGRNPHVIIEGSAYTDNGVKVTDNDPRYNGTVTMTGNVNTNVPGVYFVTYYADADNAGNVANNVERIITVTKQDGSAVLNTSLHSKSFVLQHEKNIKVIVSNRTHETGFTLMSPHTILNNSEITVENTGTHASKYSSDLKFIPNSKMFVEIIRDTIVRSNASYADHTSFVVREINDPKYHLVVEIGNENVGYTVDAHAIKIIFYNATVNDTPLFRDNSESDAIKISEYNGTVENATHAFAILDADKSFNNSMYVWNATELTYTVWFAHLSQAILDRSGSSTDQINSYGAPTLGKTGSGGQIVANGFEYNGLVVNVGRYHTEFPLISTNVGDINTVRVKIYDDSGPHGIKRVEFALGVPDIGLYHDAETIIEVWIEKDVLVVKDLIINDKFDLLEDSDVLVEISQVSCSNDATECLFVNLQYSYREAPLYNTIAVKPVNRDSQAYQFYFNDGIQVNGVSQNSDPFIAISASHAMHHPVKSGNIYLVQTDRGQGLWVDEYGYKWHIQDNMIRQISFYEYKIPHDDRKGIFHGPGRNSDGFEQIREQEHQLAFEKLPAYLRND